ncbi:response regulator [Edaphobacter sp. HDX4]|uniref:response regulator n=1 Tax=Edaphobacter sp. HDX4 TaxID=2794064 RepID=UPI002FE57AEB
MDRPCFLVVDREFPGTLSTRKLVLETAKFNVLTAYSGREAAAIFRRFPAIDGVVMDCEMEDIPAEDLARSMKALVPTVPVIVICAPGTSTCPSADFRVESFQPQMLLDTLQGLKPQETLEIERRDEQLSRDKRS